MEGVILFVDDQIFEKGTKESDLFNRFNDSEQSVLPINNLSSFQSTLNSISNFRAIILDWNFKREEIEEDVEAVSETPFEILKNSNIYSLIYIYSFEEIAESKKEELNTLFPGKIFFNKKSTGNDTEAEYKKIVDGINSFVAKNDHLEVPYLWSRSINQSVQTIFAELENADKYWIKELFYGSVRKFDKTTGEVKEQEVDPNVEVINLFQNLLGERLIQDSSLRKGIEDYSKKHFKSEPVRGSVQKLYTRLYYTTTRETDPIMTGDIFQLSENKFSIVISPECDMLKLIKNNKKIELLSFTSDDFNNRIKDFYKSEEDIKKAYNQDTSSIHLLPVFPAGNNLITGLIDFRFGHDSQDGNVLNESKKLRTLKINSPYIQQLRQRYLAYVGRVGVPLIPSTLRTTV